MRERETEGRWCGRVTVMTPVARATNSFNVVVTVAVPGSIFGEILEFDAGHE